MSHRERLQQSENATIVEAAGRAQEAPTKTTLSAASPEPLRRWFWFGLLGFLLFDGLAVLDSFLFSSDTVTTLRIVADINNMLGWLAGVFFCLSRLPRFWWRRLPPSSSLSPLQAVQRRIPLWIAIVFFVDTVERAAYLYYDTTYSHPPFSWPSIVVLLRYPFLLLALTSLYKRSPSFLKRLRLTFDGFLVMTVLMAFIWYFLLGPIILQGQQSAFAKAIVLAYPLADLILCFYLFPLAFRESKPAFRLVRRLLALGLLGIVLADLCDIVQMLHADQFWPLFQNIMLCLGYILVALAVQILWRITPEAAVSRASAEHEAIEGAEKDTKIFWRGILPVLCVPAVFFFMIILHLTGGNGPLATGVSIAGVALIIQLVARQLLAMYETFVTNQKLQRMQKELHVKNCALMQINLKLEEQTHELAAAYQQQRQANELKDQFLLSVNHELRTPLTEMHGYLELLQASQGMLDEEAHKNFLAHALNGSYELLRLVDTILDALRSEHVRGTLHYEELNVRSEVKAVLETFEPRKYENYQFVLEVPEGLKVYTDRQCLRQILSNLLSNSFKYACPQTAIVVGAAEVGSPEPAMVQIWVQDHGIGIPPADIPRLFHKFFRLPRHQTSAIRGTGLGLYICKQLVEAMDGRIWVESSGVRGEGSRFSFTLPLSSFSH